MTETFNAHTQKHRIYLNSQNGLSKDNYGNKKIIDTGLANMISAPSQEYQIALVKSTIPSTIGLFPFDTPKEDSFRLEKENEGTNLNYNIASNFKGSNVAISLWTDTTFQTQIGQMNIRFCDDGDDENIQITGTTFYNFSANLSLRDGIDNLLEILNNSAKLLNPTLITEDIFTTNPSTLSDGYGVSQICMAVTNVVAVFHYGYSNRNVLRALGASTTANSTIYKTATENIGLDAPSNIPSYLSNVLLRTDFNTNSFVSSGNGNHNIIACIPIENSSSLVNNAIISSLSVDSGTTPPTTTNNLVRKQSLTFNYQNKNLLGSHKTINTDSIGHITLELVDINGEALNLNGQNYFIELEIITKGSI